VKKCQQAFASLVSGNHLKFSISNSDNLDPADNNVSVCDLRLAKQELIINHQFSNTKATISQGAVVTAITTPTASAFFTSKCRWKREAKSASPGRGAGAARSRRHYRNLYYPTVNKVIYHAS
jgi:hypothetical protein